MIVDQTKLKERFESKVIPEPLGCHIWIAGRCCGYGVIRVSGQTVRAHRIAWQLYVGEIPIGLNVLHHCDRKLCVNPRHLFLGTQIDNIRDCVNKGRNRCGNPKGEEHGRAKLTDDEVLAIREMKGTEAKLAELFGVSRAQINNIRRRRSWKHLELLPINHSPPNSDARRGVEGGVP